MYLDKFTSHPSPLIPNLTLGLPVPLHGVNEDKIIETKCL